MAWLRSLKAFFLAILGYGLRPRVIKSHKTVVVALTQGRMEVFKTMETLSELWLNHLNVDKRIIEEDGISWNS